MKIRWLELSIYRSCGEEEEEGGGDDEEEGKANGEEESRASIHVSLNNLWYLTSICIV